MFGGLFGQEFQPREFCEFYTCFPMAFSPKTTTHLLEDGDKILLPASALNRLAILKVTYPMMFEVTNPRTNAITHVGVREFSAEEGKCYFPFWIMENLKVRNGGMVRIKNVSLPKGQFCQFQPHSVKFTELTNPRVVLERALRNYTCLTKGDTIIINHAGDKYLVHIKEVKPGNAISSVIETDMNVEFAPPLDMPEEEIHHKPPKEEAKIIVAAGSDSKMHAAESKSSQSEGGDSASYFAKLGAGRSLVGSDSIPSSSTSSTSTSSSTSSSATSPPSSSSASGTYSKVQGKFTYIYSKEGKLLRRIVTPAASAGSSKGAENTSFKAFAGQGHSLV
eukprot:g50714.t1